MIVPAEDQVDASRRGQREVLVQRQVRQRDDDVGAARAQARSGAPRSHERVVETHPRSGLGTVHRVGGEDAEETDPELAEAAQFAAFQAAERLAGRAVEHVVGKPREVRVGDALTEDLRAEVELVVAGDG